MKNLNLKYYGFYRGTVVQCLTHGYCRVRIPDILEPINDDINTIPPAEPAQPIGGGEKNNGTYIYPDIGSTVWCFFEGGNLEDPVYFAISNSQSEIWQNVAIAQKPNTNKGNDGVSVFPAGHITTFNNSKISQTSVIDESTGLNKSDTIQLLVNATNESNDLHNSQIKPDYSNGAFSPVAASITLENKTDTLTLEARNEIIIRAPKITINSTNMGSSGTVSITGNLIENRTPSDGFFRVINSEVNIDAGKNNIILQSANGIKEIIVEPESTT